MLAMGDYAPARTRRHYGVLNRYAIHSTSGYECDCSETMLYIVIRLFVATAGRKSCLGTKRGGQQASIKKQKQVVVPPFAPSCISKFFAF
jgi:hypothetical protein